MSIPAAILNAPCCLCFHFEKLIHLLLCLLILDTLIGILSRGPHPCVSIPSGSVSTPPHQPLLLLGLHHQEVSATPARQCVSTISCSIFIRSISTFNTTAAVSGIMSSCLNIHWETCKGFNRELGSRSRIRSSACSKTVSMPPIRFKLARLSLPGASHSTRVGV